MKRIQRVFGDLDSLRFVDGRLDDERRAAFVGHLDDDATEAERVAIWTRQNEALRAAFAGITLEPVPVTLRLTPITPAPRPIATALPDRQPPTQRAAEPAGGGTEIAYLKAKVRPARHTAAAAYRVPLTAAMLFIVAVLVLYLAHGLIPAGAAAFGAGSGGPSEGVAQPTMLDRAADAHTTYALDPVRPVEFTAKQVLPMNQWLQRRLGVTVTAPDLAAEGWTLLGGRLVPGAGVPGALFIYEDAGGERLSVFAQRGTAPLAVSLGSAGSDLAAMSWGSGPIAYVITVGRSIDWLSRNGEELRERIARAD